MDRMPHVVCVFALLLLAVTWRLWTPQTAFPEVPLFLIAARLPRFLDWLWLATLIGMLVAGVFAGEGSGQRRAFTFVALALLMLFAVNQHRLQPWAYQFFWYSLLIAFARGRARVRWMRILAISIYAFSAFSKLDFQFAQTLGIEFTETLLSFVGIDISSWQDSTQATVALTLPLGELTIATLLCFRKTRFAGAVMAVGMHATLLLILGPLGLHHAPGVLVWNLFFIAQAVCLFMLPDFGRANDVDAKSSGATSGEDSDSPECHFPRTVACVVWTVALLPLLEPIDRYDHWLAWGLYAPRSSRVTVWVGPRLADDLPKRISQHVDSRGQLHLDNWSLDSLGVPIYPHARFQLGVAQSLLRYEAASRDLRVDVLGPSGRFDGKRAKRTARGDALRMESTRFHFGSRPR